MSEVAHRVMGREEAERLTERIRHAAASFVEAKEKLTRFIGEAQEGRAWEALGFRSWTEYVAQVFSDTPLMRLTRDERRELVAELSEAGMSTRAIAPIVGAPRETVRRDVLSAGDPSGSPASERRTATFQSGGGFLGPGEKIEPDTETVVDLDTGDVLSERSITGMDGKTYRTPVRPANDPTNPAGAGTPKRRRAITDQAAEIGWEVRKEADKLLKLLEDDRFTRNKEEVTAHLRGHLEHMMTACNAVLDA